MIVSATDPNNLLRTSSDDGMSFIFGMLPTGLSIQRIEGTRLALAHHPRSLSDPAFTSVFLVLAEMHPDAWIVIDVVSKTQADNIANLLQGISHGDPEPALGLEADIIPIQDGLTLGVQDTPSAPVQLLNLLRGVTDEGDGYRAFYRSGSLKTDQTTEDDDES